MQENIYTLVADFAVRNRLAYLSHQETLTCLQRAMIRAQIPMAFSSGFNPRPYLSIPLPRSVGTLSESERVCAVIAADGPVSVHTVRDRLALQLPEDCALLSLQCFEGKHVFIPRAARYLFSLSDDFNDTEKDHLEQCSRSVRGKAVILIDRFQVKKKRIIQMDISPYVEQLVFSAKTVEVLCRISQEGTVRVDELMQWLKIDPGRLTAPVQRTEVQWE